MFYVCECVHGAFGSQTISIKGKPTDDKKEVLQAQTLRVAFIHGVFKPMAF